MGPNEVLDKGFIADDEIPEFHVVDQSDVDHCELQDTAGGDWVGISQESADEVDVANRRVLRVRTMGVSRAVAGGEVALKARVAANTSGELVTASDGDYVVGIARTPASVAGDWFNVELTPGVQLPSA